MTNEQTSQAISLINALWPQKPLDAQAGALVGSMIAGYEFSAITGALRKLATTEEWFHVSKLIKALKPPTTSALEGFKKALMVTRVYSLDQRDQNAPDAVRATVARLGGWRVIGQMKTAEQQWNEKRWAAAWEEVHAEIAAGRPMAELLPAPGVLPKLQDADRNVFGEIMDRGATSKALAAMLGKGGE